nr:hypothetical protein [uncultured Rhodoferax sp.]
MVHRGARLDVTNSERNTLFHLGPIVALRKMLEKAVRDVAAGKPGPKATSRPSN